MEWTGLARGGYLGSGTPPFPQSNPPGSMFFLRLFLGFLAFLAASVVGAGAALVRRDVSLVPYRYARLLARLMRPAFGLKVVVHGEENLHRERPCIYISNHQSIYDVPVLAGIYPPDTVVIGKKELRGIPIFGWIYARTGNVLIDRSRREDAVGRLGEATEAIRREGKSIWIFPEGTRTSVQGELLPFKKGAFHMAVKTGVPLVPVVVAPVKRLWDLKRLRIRPGTVEVRVLEPIPVAHLTEAEIPELVREAHRRMTEALHELAARTELPPAREGLTP